MKNKILYIVITLIFSFCFMNYSVAEEETDINTTIEQTSMPTDAEIMETIRKFNFNKAQEEYLFKETKRKLNEIYSNKNFSPVTSGETTIDTTNIDLENVKTKKYSRRSKIKNIK